MDTLVGGGLFTAIGAVLVALIHKGSKGIISRLNRIEDKLDDHIQWHLSGARYHRKP